MRAKWDRPVAATLALAIVILLIAFFSYPPFFDWAFTRHQNTASWGARPLLLLPFCYFAWKRSLAGIMLSVMAILTSMFWFPAPIQPNDDVLRFLAAERRILEEGWSVRNMLGFIVVMIYCSALATAFWKRSWKIGLAVAGAGALLKSLWSVVFSPDAGTSVIPFALGGFIVLVVAVLVIRQFSRAGS